MSKSKNRSNRESETTIDADGNEVPAVKEKRQAAAPKVPEGYISQSSDIVGVWDSDGDPIHMIPIEAKLSDSKLDEFKPSILVFARLVDECVVTSSETDEEILASPGDIVGIWAKPGMAALKNLAGQKVYMYPNGEKDTGKPNAMKLFFVGSKVKGAPLPITDDRRDKSRHAATFLTPSLPGQRSGGGAQNGQRRQKGAEEVDTGDMLPY